MVEHNEFFWYEMPGRDSRALDGKGYLSVTVAMPLSAVNTNICHDHDQIRSCQLSYWCNEFLHVPVVNFHIELKSFFVIAPSVRTFEF